MYTAVDGMGKGKGIGKGKNKQGRAPSDFEQMYTIGYTTPRWSFFMSHEAVKTHDNSEKYHGVHKYHKRTTLGVF
jgi:hypothetical protein